MQRPRSWGVLLLAIWLILWGLLTAPFLQFSFAYKFDVLAVFAIVVGVFLILDR
jgi:uncharacterized membrane protein HdeD (DUF308 family)